MKRSAIILGLTLVTACGGGGEPAPAQNEAARVSGDLLRQSQQIAQQGNELAVAAEREFENQTAIVFDNRANPFNDSTKAEADEPLGEVDETP